MAESTQVSNIVGAMVANLINVLVISVFVARLSNRPKIEYWLGIILILSIVPLAYLFITAFGFKRHFLYFIQKLLEVNLPLDILTTLKPKKMSKAEKAMVSSVSQARLARDNLVYSLYLNMAGNILYKLKFILLSLFPAPRQLAQIYPAEARYLIFLNYFKRFDRRFGEALRVVGRCLDN